MDTKICDQYLFRENEFQIFSTVNELLNLKLFETNLFFPSYNDIFLSLLMMSKKSHSMTKSFTYDFFRILNLISAKNHIIVFFNI